MADDDAPRDFIRDIVAEDLEAGRVPQVVTRFPPEPNGYLHIGHAMAVCLNFGIAEEFDGVCRLRFDDTNPVAEDEEYVRAIEEDVRRLGFDWEGDARHASDYYDRMYEWARTLVEKGLAYVDEQDPDTIRETRGTVESPGVDSPHRDRPAEESLDLLERMKAGELEEGAAVLRAKIDMAHDNMLMRDPIMYRIRKTPHHRTGTDWSIYPTYDWAHGLEDAIEGVTHSLCSLEFETHRLLYDWYLDSLELDPRPRQIEFGRMGLTHTVLSKRKLRTMVEEGIVDGWDDPRMPTLRGMFRRGFTAEAIREFIRRAGVARMNRVNEVELLEHCVRDHLNRTAQRRMAVLDPLRLTVTNWPDGAVEEFDVVNNPEDESAGTRRVAFGGTAWIERDDFMEEPVRKFKRLAPGREVRLRNCCLVTCEEVVKDDDGEIVEIRCTWDPESRGGAAPDGRKVKGTIHWVDVGTAVDAEVRQYDRLFTAENPDAEDDWQACLNPDSLVTVPSAKVEPAAAETPVGDVIQFERIGYFSADPDGTPDRPVFNRTVGLRDTWKRMQKRSGS